VAERAGGRVVAHFNWTDAPMVRTTAAGVRLDLPPHSARLVDG
jgi:hypothetical protein